jgi:small subunit ribosomal protein S4
MPKIKEKKERALNTKLFLKADRCNSPKCVMVRRPYRPGDHGQRRRPPSEYGKQLQEKQKAQIIYGLSNRQLVTIFRNPKEKIFQMLEQRLDRVVHLLGFAASPRIARQLVSHGHILVDNRKVTSSSHRVRVGNVIEIRPQSLTSKVFEGLDEQLKNHETPDWLELDPKSKKGKCKTDPQFEHDSLPFDIDLVGEFYAR